jgi:hypothetical protein
VSWEPAKKVTVGLGGGVPALAGEKAVGLADALFE